MGDEAHACELGKDCKLEGALNSQQDETLIYFILVSNPVYIPLEYSDKRGNGNGWHCEGESGLCRSPQTRGQ